MAVLLITHDLGVVAETADRLAVMYAGQIVETATVAGFLRRPRPSLQPPADGEPAERRQARGRLAVIPGRVPPLGSALPRLPLRRSLSAGDGRLPRTEPPRWTGARGGAGGALPSVGSGRAGRQSPGRWAAAVPSAAAVADDRAGGRGRAPAARPGPCRSTFPIHRGVFRRVVGQVRAVDGVSLDLQAGRTLALVGESGCGKTTAGKGILQLIPPTGGSVRYLGRELRGLGHRRMRPFRKDLQIIFQDPFAAMNPRMLVGDIIGEGLQALRIERSRAGRMRRVAELLDLVGMDPDAADRYPHEFSGGQRQRICIARALAVEPKLIVCDEPTSALDVSVQAQILNLLKDLQERLGLAYLFITHNISVVAYLAHEVAVMYLGRVVEQGPVDEVLDDPRHPYTRALLSAVPVVDRDNAARSSGWRATCPRRATPRPAATSIPAVPRPSTPVHSLSR